MEQQQAHFDESPSYAAGYEEVPRYKDYFPDSREQKLAPREQLMTPTTGQRLILAIVSLAMLFLMFLAVILLATTGALAPTMAQNFAPVFALMFLGLFVAVIVMNMVFNRKR